MEFIPFQELTDEQKQKVAAKWPPRDGDPLEGYEITFQDDRVSPFARRVIPKPAEAPAPVKAAPTCPKCGKTFANPKALGPHSRYCKGVAVGEPLEQKPVGVLIVDERPAAAESLKTFTAAKLGEPWQEPSPEIAAAAGRVVAAHIVKIPVVCLEDSPTQPRQNYDTGKHEELVASMRAHGWFEAWPALVRKLPGAAAEALPVDVNNPEGQWTLCRPSSREELFPGRHWPREEAEHLAATTYAHRYETVFGHRRRRAAVAASITDAPCIVQALEDAKVLELQLIENLRRQDLNPIEEAEHLARLLSLRTPDGKPAHTKESLAAKVGSSVRHITLALSLAGLVGEVRDAVSEGKLGVAIAYELARIPDAELQAKAAAEIINPSEGEGPMRKAAALDYIRRTCTRNLRTEAKFATDDAELVPVRHRIDPTDAEKTERYFGGSCVDCPFNSANSDDPSKRGPKLGVCANVACFDAKHKAHFERFRAKHNDPDAGRVVVPLERNQEIFGPEGEVAWGAGLVPLDAAPDAGLLKNPDEADQAPKWRELTKGKLPEVLVAMHPKTGKPVELVPLEVAKTAAELNENPIFKTSRAPRGNDEQHRAATLATKKEQDTARLTFTKLLADVSARAKALGQLPHGSFESLAFWGLEIVSKPALEIVARRRGLESATLCNVVADGEESDRLALFAELLLADHWHANCPDLAAKFAAHFGVILADVRERARLEVEADHAPKPHDPSLPATDVWRALSFMPPDQIETGFSFDGNLAENPDRLEIMLPENKKAPFRVIVEAAADKVGPVVRWFAGYEIEAAEFGIASKVLNASTPHPSRFAALAHVAQIVADRLDAEERVSNRARKAMRAALADLDARAEAERLAAGPEDAGDPPPTHLAVLTKFAAQHGQEPIVKAYDADEWLEALHSPSVWWVLPIGGVRSLAEAEDAARAAIAEGVGTITTAGTIEGFALKPEAPAEQAAPETETNEPAA